VAAIREPEAGGDLRKMGSRVRVTWRPNSARRRRIRVLPEGSCGGGGYWLGHKEAHLWPKLAENRGGKTEEANEMRG